MILFIFFAIASCKRISVSIVPSGPFEYGRQYLVNAYMRHMYNPYSFDEMEIRISGQQLMGWTRINEKQKILHTIMNANLRDVVHQQCMQTYYLDTIPPRTSQVYLIIDREACHSQVLAAEALKKRYTYVFPVGVGHYISDRTLIQLAGPCDICLPGYNYIHIV